MPKLETVEQFIAMVESNQHDKAIEVYYTVDASMQENQSKPRIGKEQLITHEKNILSKVASLTSLCIRPFFIQDNDVVIRWYFRFEWKDGTVSEIEEMTCQEWKGELIDKETFFYDPKQFVPK